jgi:AraC-like DNA-binding protein
MTNHANTNTVSMTYLQALFEYTRSHGLSNDVLLDGVALNLQDNDLRCSELDAAALFDRAALLLNDDALGLHVGEHIRPVHYGVLGYVIMNCATLGDTIDYVRRYQALVIDPGTLDVSVEPQGAVMAWPPDDEDPLRQLAEFNFAAMVCFIRWVSGYAGNPLRIDFNYPAPANLDEHRRLFGCKLCFDQPYFRLVLPLDWLSRPLIEPNGMVHAAMLRLAENQLLALPRGADLLLRARSSIARCLSLGDVELAKVAQELGVGSRTLQRALQDDGRNFSGLVDQVRRELAERNLSDASLSSVDLAFLLGFSDQSAFQRAFKRWTGSTPGEYRRQQGVRSS